MTATKIIIRRCSRLMTSNDLRLGKTSKSHRKAYKSVIKPETTTSMTTKVFNHNNLCCRRVAEKRTTVITSNFD